MIEKPVLQALVLADHIYVDKDTGKKIIAGTFHELIGRASFPTNLGFVTNAFISLTNFSGKRTIKLRYVDLAESKILLETSDIEISCDDPLRTVDCVVQIPPFPMPHPGAYAFEVDCNGEIVGALRITVMEMPKEN